MATRRPGVPLQEALVRAVALRSGRIPRQDAAVLRKAKQFEDTPIPRHKQGELCGRLNLAGCRICYVARCHIRQRKASAKAERVLGWKPRSREDAIVATAESLVKFGIVGPAAR
jgi:hypothetical protein